MRGSTLTRINWRVQTPGKECRKKWCVKNIEEITHKEMLKTYFSRRKKPTEGSA